MGFKEAYFLRPDATGDDMESGDPPSTCIRPSSTPANTIPQIKAVRGVNISECMHACAIDDIHIPCKAEHPGILIASAQPTTNQWPSLACAVAPRAGRRDVSRFPLRTSTPSRASQSAIWAPRPDERQRSRGGACMPPHHGRVSRQGWLSHGAVGTPGPAGADRSQGAWVCVVTFGGSAPAVTEVSPGRDRAVQLGRGGGAGDL